MRVKNVGDHLVEMEENMFTVGYGLVFHHTKNEMKKILKVACCWHRGQRQAYGSSEISESECI